MNHNYDNDEEWTLVGKKSGSGSQYRSMFSAPASSTRQGKNWKFIKNMNNCENHQNHQNHQMLIENEETKLRNENYKKILCKNINNIGKCIYNNKCLYAHSLEEQNVEPIRVQAYNMIKKNEDLSQIDLSKSKHLYNNLLSLTKECQLCLDKKCTGGYNCKHGVCEKKYMICQTDLNKGTCDGNCGKKHLTEKGLIPYGVNIMKNFKTKPQIPKPIVINDDFFKYLEKNSICLYQDGSDHTENKYQDNDSECSETYNEMLSHQMSDDSFCDLKFDCNQSREEKLNQSIFKALALNTVKCQKIE